MNIPFDIVTHTLALKGLVSDQKSANRCDVDPTVCVTSFPFVADIRGHNEDTARANVYAVPWWHSRTKCVANNQTPEAKARGLFQYLMSKEEKVNSNQSNRPFRWPSYTHTRNESRLSDVRWRAEQKK